MAPVSHRETRESGSGLPCISRLRSKGEILDFHHCTFVSTRFVSNVDPAPLPARTAMGSGTVA